MILVFDDEDNGNFLKQLKGKKFYITEFLGSKLE